MASPSGVKSAPTAARLAWRDDRAKGLVDHAIARLAQLTLHLAAPRAPCYGAGCHGPRQRTIEWDEHEPPFPRPAGRVEPGFAEHRAHPLTKGTAGSYHLHVTHARVSGNSDFAAHVVHRITPRSVQGRQMKVPQSAHG